MTIAIISDIHGNIEALRKVLADMSQRSVDHFICLGDVVSFGPYPRECVESVSAIPEVVWIRGNHDRYVGERTFMMDKFIAQRPAGFTANEEWTYGQLGPDHLATLSALPPSADLQVGSAALHFVHASKMSDEDLVWGDASETELEKRLGRGGIRAYGHIHHQYVRTARGTTYLNPGSVGLPFDGNPAAAYALVCVAAGTIGVELVRVPYDVTKTIADLERRQVPWIAPLRSALEMSLSFFSDEVKAANDKREYEPKHT